MERSGALLTRAAKVFFDLTAVEHERRAAEDRSRGRAEARRAPGRDLPEPEAVRAREDALRHARHPRLDAESKVPRRALPTSTSSAPARSSPTPTRPRCARSTRKSRSSRRSSASKSSRDTDKSAHRRRRQGRARRPERRRHRRRRRRGEGARSSTASGSSRCRTRRSSRRSASLQNRALRERLFNASISRGRSRRRERHAQRSSSASPSSAPSAPSSSAIRPTRRTARRSDGEDARDRDQAADRHGPGARPPRRAPRPPRCRQLIDAQNGGFKLAPWDWEFYAEQVRKAKYDLDESQIKPYFELDHVLQDGVFYAAQQALRHSPSRSARTSRSISPTCACSKSSTPTASRWRSSTPTTSSATTRAAAPGWTASSTSRRLLGTKPVVFNVAQLHRSRRPASRRCSPSTT